jgi:hypothetical protein
MRAGQRQESNVTCTFDCFGDLPLMLGAVTRNTTWDYLPSLGNEVTKGSWILVIDANLLVSAETTYLATLKGALFPWP